VPSDNKTLPAVAPADEGIVEVEKLGAAAALDSNILPVVPGPASMDGTPVALVTSNALLAVANADMTLAADAESNVFIALVFG